MSFESPQVYGYNSQTCIRRQLLGRLKSDHLGQLVVLQNTFKNDHKPNRVVRSGFLDLFQLWMFYKQ